jgi:hypothetical protein
MRPVLTAWVQKTGRRSAIPGRPWESGEILFSQFLARESLSLDLHTLSAASAVVEEGAVIGGKHLDGTIFQTLARDPVVC